VSSLETHSAVNKIPSRCEMHRPAQRSALGKVHPNC